MLLVVEALSHVRLFATPWTAAHQAALTFTISWSLLKLMSTESMMLKSLSAILLKMESHWKLLNWVHMQSELVFRRSTQRTVK